LLTTLPRLLENGMTARAALLAAIAVFAAASASAQQSDRAGAYLQQCKICHSFEAGGRTIVGPNLHGLFGRKAGTVGEPSDAMRGSGIVWNEATLGQFLRDPRGLVPGNKMSFPGIPDAAVLSDLIGRLKQATQ
jgi:cytochrome c